MIVNGETFSLASNSEVHSIQDLVQHFKLHPAIVVVDRNGSIAPRQEWEDILLKEEDHIELIRFVGGG